MIDLNAIRARADAATPGPWVVREHPDQEGGTDYRVETQLMCINGLAAWFGIATFCEDSAGEQMTDGAYRPVGDAEFIAHARSDIPALLDLVDAQKAEIDRHKTYLEELIQERLDEMGAEADAFDKDAINALRFILKHHCGDAGQELLRDLDGWSPDNAIECIAEEIRRLCAAESRLTASASSGRNAGEVAREIAQQLAKETAWPVNYNQLWLAMAIESALEARDKAHAGREERLRRELEEIELACERAAHPAAPVCLSETHVAHLQQIASKCRAAIADQPASPAPVTETNDV